MLELTEAARDALAYNVVRDFLLRHRADELPFFDTFWRTFRAATPAGPHAGQLWNDGLGVDDEAHAESLAPVVAVIVWTVINDLVQKRELPSLDSAPRAIAACAQALGIARLLAEQLANQLAPGIVQAFQPFCLRAEPPFLVQWIENANKPGSGWQRPDVRPMSDHEVQARFRQSAERFMLFVDEPNRKIRVSQREENLWPLVIGQLRRFLFLVLEALRRETISYDCMDKVLFVHHVQVESIARGRLKSELNTKLGGVLADVLKAYRDGCYTVVAPLTHCWIRSSTGSSRLLSEP